MKYYVSILFKEVIDVKDREAAEKWVNSALEEGWFGDGEVTVKEIKEE